MEISYKMFLIVCPLLFLAGFVDAIGGGGGLISLPAYLLAGLPYQFAVGCNKLSATCGTVLTMVRFLKNKLVNLKLAVPTIVAAIAGSYAGAHLMLSMDNSFMEKFLLVMLPVTALIVMHPKLFLDNPAGKLVLDPKTWITAILVALIMGFYDGFYGPGSGTFMIIAFTLFTRMSLPQANAQTKVINLTTNITSLTILLLEGSVVLTLGLAGAACNMLGSFLGAGLAIRNNTRVTRPVIILVLGLLFLKIFHVF